MRPRIFEILNDKDVESKQDRLKKLSELSELPQLQEAHEILEEIFFHKSIVYFWMEPGSQENFEIFKDKKTFTVESIPLLQKLEDKCHYTQAAWSIGKRDELQEAIPDFLECFFEYVRAELPNKEIYYLRNALLFPLLAALQLSKKEFRKKAIFSLNSAFSNLSDNNKWDDLHLLLEETHRALKLTPKFCSLFNEWFNRAVDFFEEKMITHKLAALDLERLYSLDNYKRKGLTSIERRRRIAQIHEIKADCSTSSMQEAMELEQAAILYQTIGDMGGFDRVSRRKIEAGKRVIQNEVAPMPVPTEIMQPFYDRVNSQVDEILKMLPENIFVLLAGDVFELTPDHNNSQTEDILSLLSTSVSFASDGRTTSISASGEPKSKKFDFKVWIETFNPKINGFAFVLAETLKKEGALEACLNQLYQIPGMTDSEKPKCSELLISFTEHKHFQFMSMATPFIEGVVRHLYSSLGLNPISAQLNNDGFDKYKPLESMLKDPRFVSAMPDDLIRYLKLVLSKDNDIGFNLRNNIAHGILSWEDYNLFYSWILMSVIFLLSGLTPTTQESSQ